MGGAKRGVGGRKRPKKAWKGKGPSPSLFLFFPVPWAKVKFQGCIQSFVLPWKLRKSHIYLSSKSFISIFFNCQVSACELQPFSCHDLANDIYSQTAKTVFSHLKPSSKNVFSVRSRPLHFFVTASLFLFYVIGKMGKNRNQQALPSTSVSLQSCF